MDSWRVLSGKKDLLQEAISYGVPLVSEPEDTIEVNWLGVRTTQVHEQGVPASGVPAWRKATLRAYSRDPLRAPSAPVSPSLPP